MTLDLGESAVVSLGAATTMEATNFSALLPQFLDNSDSFPFEGARTTADTTFATLRGTLTGVKYGVKCGGAQPIALLSAPDSAEINDGMYGTTD